MRLLSFAQFVGHYSGLYIYSDGSMGANPYGAQCVNLPNVWMQNIGAEQFPGNAATFEFDSHPDCDWIPNTPTNYPMPGDIVVWAASSAAGLPYGHVDLGLQGANVNNFTGFDQNWPLNSPCHSEWHNYNDVAGFLRPRKARFWGAFAGKVDSAGVNIRAGAGTEEPVIATGPGGASLTFDGYVHHGPGIPDAITGALDDRWFHVVGGAPGGWCASAEINGNPNY